MARAIVGNPFLDQIPTVSATATPVETFKKSVLTKGPFEALSETLTRINAKADPILQRMQERKNEADYAEGVELYNATQKSMGDAVRDGVIQAGESPYVRKGYRISNLQALGTDYAVALEQQLYKKQLYKNSDPEAMDKFLKEFNDSFRETNGFESFSDVEVAQFFTSTQTQTDTAFTKAWVKENNSWNTKQAYAAVENSVAKTLLGLDIGKAGDTPEIAQAKMQVAKQQIMTQASNAELNGLDRSTVSDMIANAVIGMAESSSNSSYLSILDDVKIGTGSFSDILKYKTRIADANYRIETQKFNLEERNFKLGERAQSEASVSIYQDAMQELRDGDFTKFDIPSIEAKAQQLREVGTRESIALSEDLLRLSRIETDLSLEAPRVSAADVAQATNDRIVFLEDNTDPTRVRQFLLRQAEQGLITPADFDAQNTRWKVAQKVGKPWDTVASVSQVYKLYQKRGLKEKEIDVYGQPLGLEAMDITVLAAQEFRDTFITISEESPSWSQEKVGVETYKLLTVNDGPTDTVLPLDTGRLDEADNTDSAFQLGWKGTIPFLQDFWNLEDTSMLTIPGMLRGAVNTVDGLIGTTETPPDNTGSE